jgi:sarcosine/dimethylglycine N-methyltransferase
MADGYSSAIEETAREYYNSDDADNFYFHVWGGEDIHVGLYQSDEEPIRDASRRTVERMAEKYDKLSAETRIIDVGGGYGGSMRYLAHQFGCPSVVLNISEKENERDRQMNKEQGVDDLIEVVDGSFESIPYDAGAFDGAWSQDAILHSGDRQKVLAETCRVLKPGSLFVFTDPMQADDAPTDQLQPIYDRIHLESLGSPGFYKQAAEKVGFEVVEYEDHSRQLPRHYGRVLEELVTREDELKAKNIISAEYIERMKKGLSHWVEGGQKGYLAWGIFTLRKK